MSIARTAATGGDLDPEFLAWSTSLPVDRRLLEVDCLGSVAHVRGLEAAGLVTAQEAQTLATALRELPKRVKEGEVVLPEHEEDVHMAVEHLLAEEIGDVVAKLHTGRSRNDQVATDMMLWCRASVDRIEAEIDAMLASADLWNEEHGDIPLPSYTHRQVAVPTLAHLWLKGAMVAPISRDRELLAPVRAELAQCPLGSGAVGGTTLPIDTSIAAAGLEFEGGPTNPIDSVGSRDYALTLLFVCARLGLHMGRFCADVIELASDGLLRIGGAIAGGSSMMPHKRNPDLFELVRGQSALRQSELSALMMTFHGLGSGYHRDLQQDKQIVFSAVDGVCNCLRMLSLALPHLFPDAETCLRALSEGDAVATDLCDALVEGGMPFREAYAAVGRLVVSQREHGKRLVDLTRDELQAMGLDPNLVSRLDPTASAQRRAARF